jgi:hypothetical protein
MMLPTSKFSTKVDTALMKHTLSRVLVTDGVRIGNWIY